MKRRFETYCHGGQALAIIPTLMLAADPCSEKSMRRCSIAVLALFAMSPGSVAGRPDRPRRPFLTSELIFPLEHWHNHASMVVELPGGDLFVCWFHGSGERTADDVVVRGARLRKGAKTWSEPFLLADTPGYPDTNATLFLDPKKRLWLMWPTILANEWHTALMKYKIASDYAQRRRAALGRQRGHARHARR